MNVTELVVQALQLPALQGALVALCTQAVKRAPVGPSGGPGIRLVAALLAAGAVLAGAAADGTLGQLDAETVGRHCVEVAGAFMAAVGAWQLSRRTDSADQQG